MLNRFRWSPMLFDNRLVINAPKRESLAIEYGDALVQFVCSIFRCWRRDPQRSKFQFSSQHNTFVKILLRVRVWESHVSRTILILLVNTSMRCALRQLIPRYFNVHHDILLRRSLVLNFVLILGSYASNC